MRLSSDWLAATGAFLLAGFSVFSLSSGEPVRPMVEATDSGPSSPAMSDFMSTFPGCKGTGCRALDPTRDSLLFGPDGVLDSGDEWQGKVWKITVCPDHNEDPTQPGTWYAIRDSLDQSQYRTGYYNVVQVWVVGSCKDTTSDTYIAHTYFAGQTAPNEGAQFWGPGRVRFQEDGGNLPNNVAVRYMKQRRYGNTGMLFESCSHVILDHISSQWSAQGGGQYNLRVGGDSTLVSGLNCTDIGFFRVLTGEPRLDHPTLLGLTVSPRNDGAGRRIGLVRSLLYGRGHRCPNVQGHTILVAGNIIYNCRDRHSVVGNTVQVDFLGHFVHTGPATQAGSGRELPILVHDGCELTHSNVPNVVCTPRIFVDNISYINEADGDTLWDHGSPYKGTDSLVVCRDLNIADDAELDPSGFSCATQGDTVHTGVVKSGPHSLEDLGLPSYMYPHADTAPFLDTTRAVAQALDVGANARLACDGTLITVRDTVDTDAVNRFLNDLRNLTPIGFVNIAEDADGPRGMFNVQVSESTTDTVSVAGDGDAPPPGGHEYVGPDTTDANAVLCADADDDGQFDAWETRFGLDPSDPADAWLDLDGDLYLNIEEFLNGTNPNVFTFAGNGAEGEGVAPEPVRMNAFPGATGFAATALWNETGDTALASRACNFANTEIHVVTDLGGSGPGTLDSIMTNELREDTVDVVVWNVSGEYSAGAVTMTDFTCIVFAPWTAPEPGVDWNDRLTNRGSLSNTRDHVYLGFKFSPDNAKSASVPGINGGQRILWSHFTARGCDNDCSEVFADDDISGVTLPMKDITLANFIVGPGVVSSRGIGCRADDSETDRTGIYRCEIHTGLIVHHRNRMPLFVMRTPNVDSGAVVANIASYNGDFAMMEMKDTIHLDIRSVCVARGPMTGASHILAYDTLDGTSTFYNQGHIYIDETDTASAGGTNPCSGGAPADQWSRLRYAHNPSVELDSTKYGVGRTGPQPEVSFPINLLPLEDVWPEVVKVAPTLGTELGPTELLVGAGIRIGSDGRRYAMRGDIDSTVVAEARSNGGPSAMYSSTGDYGPDDTNLGSGSAWTDKDSDGLPDDFEVRICGEADSTCATPAGDPDRDLYINAIEYASGFDPTTFTASDGSEEAPASATYGESIWIFQAPVIAQDTVCYNSNGLVVSCPGTFQVVLRTWDPDSIPSGSEGKECWEDDFSHRIWATEEYLEGGNLLDSATADGVFAGISQAGCDTASIKTLPVVP